VVGPSSRSALAPLGRFSRGRLSLLSRSLAPPPPSPSREASTRLVGSVEPGLCCLARTGPHGWNPAREVSTRLGGLGWHRSLLPTAPLGVPAALAFLRRHFPSGRSVQPEHVGCDASVGRWYEQDKAEGYGGAQPCLQSSVPQRPPSRTTDVVVLEPM